MKVLITGGAGFIGSHIVDACRLNGMDVRVIDSLDPGVHRQAPSYLRSDVDYCFQDLRHWQPTAQDDDVEAVIHLAALGGVSRAGKERANVLAANGAGTANLVEAATKWRSLKAFVLASSFSIYGSQYTYLCPKCEHEGEGDRAESDMKAGRYEVYCPTCGSEKGIRPVRESAVPSPLEAYAASKYIQELCLRGVDLPTTIFRFSSAYGTRLRLDDGEATIIAKLAGWIGRGEAPSLFEDGLQQRDWVHVKDIVAAVLSVLSGKANHPIVNICSGYPMTLKGACDLLAKGFNVNVSPKIVGGYRPGDMRHCLGDPSRFRELVGRDPIRFTEGVMDLCSR
jgi:dTDP-L-rhamnose 4-epimerase